MFTPDKEGVTMYDHLKQLEKVTGETPAELIPPPLPPGTGHLWQWFWELDSGRGGDFGVKPLSFVEILAWCRLMRTRLTPYEISIIKEMDAERLKKV
jgi:hypothetical protein